MPWDDNLLSDPIQTHVDGTNHDPLIVRASHTSPPLRQTTPASHSSLAPHLPIRLNQPHGLPRVSTHLIGSQTQHTSVRKRPSAGPEIQQSHRDINNWDALRAGDSPVLDNRGARLHKLTGVERQYSVCPGKGVHRWTRRSVVFWAMQVREGGDGLRCGGWPR
jgi:hypothetical protein